MTSEKYNGWKNYETWAVKLWLDNDAEGPYKDILDHASDIRELEAHPVDALGKWLKEYASEGAPDLGASMYADLLGSALDAVDWEEIATAILEELED